MKSFLILALVLLDIADQQRTALDLGQQIVFKEQQIKDTEARLKSLRIEASDAMAAAESNAKLLVEVSQSKGDLTEGWLMAIDFDLRSSINLCFQKQAEIRNLLRTISLMQEDLKKSKPIAEAAVNKAADAFNLSLTARNEIHSSLLSQITNFAYSAYTRNPEIRWNPAYIQTNLNNNFSKFKVNPIQINRLRHQLTNSVAIPTP